MSDTEKFVIARLQQIGDPGSQEFSIGSGDWPLQGFVVRRGEQAFAYLNRCPHAGHPLNFRPSNDFLSLDRQFIMCRSHGALFELKSGHCVAGPCPGQALRSFAVSIDDGDVVLHLDKEIASRLAGA